MTNNYRAQHRYMDGAQLPVSEAVKVKRIWERDIVK